jgi:hypothetical protein
LRGGPHEAPHAIRERGAGVAVKESIPAGMSLRDIRSL